MSAHDSITLQSVPQRSPQAGWIQLDGEVVAYVPGNGTVEVLNPSASLLWECLDGTTRLADLADELAHAVGGDRRDIARQLIGFVRELTGRGLLARPSHVPTREPGDEVPSAQARARARPPNP